MGPSTVAYLDTASADVDAKVRPTDVAGLEELYRKHVRQIQGWIRRQVRDDAVAEDLTAQVFFRAWTSAARFRGEGSYEAWLFRIARNCVADERAAAQRLLSIADPPEAADPAPSPAAQAIAREDARLLLDLIAQLPEAERRAIKLRYLQEMSVDEVARALRRTRGAVRVLLHRARARLRHTAEERDGGRTG